MLAEQNPKALCSYKVSPVQNNQKVVAAPKKFGDKSLGSKVLIWLHQWLSWPEPDARLWQNHLLRKQGNYTSGLFLNWISTFLFVGMRCNHLSNVVCWVVHRVRHGQQHSSPNTLRLCTWKGHTSLLEAQKIFGECNKKLTDPASWPCLGQQLNVISTISCSVYFNKLLSISIKILLFYSIFLPLDTQTHLSAAVRLKQWQQMERSAISGSSSRVCTHTPKFTFFNSFFFTKCIWKPYRIFLAGQWFMLRQQIIL